MDWTQVFTIISVNVALMYWLKQDINRIEMETTSLKNDNMQIKCDLVEIKTMLHMKDCCMIKDSSQLKKVE